jgi:hypothetical protein
MTELIDTLRSELVERIAQLEPQIRELERLQEALDALNGVPARRASSSPAPFVGDADPVGTHVRGVRQRQALTAIHQRPGMYTQELAEELGLEPGLVYAPVRRLISAGLIVKRDFRLYPA